MKSEKTSIVPFAVEREGWIGVLALSVNGE
jgi:hypothetical protein